MTGALDGIGAALAAELADRGAHVAVSARSADRLAARFKCPVVYVSIKRVRRGYYEIELTELYDGDSPLPVDEFPITDAFVRHLERDIKAAPEQYLWTHRRWKHKRS